MIKWKNIETVAKTVYLFNLIATSYFYMVVRRLRYEKSTKRKKRNSTHVNYVLTQEMILSKYFAFYVLIIYKR